MTHQPKVSILVPVYKVEPFIERCVRSVFRQTYQNIEFIFVNDDSPDSSILILKKVIEQYPERKDKIRIIEHDKNKGIGAARNTLLQAATGDYLLWVDSDDYISYDAVEVLVLQIEESGADILTSDSYFFYKGENNILTFSQSFPTDSKQYIEAMSSHKVRAALWATLSKRSVWLENKIIIPESSSFGEDYFATVQLFYFSHKIRVIHSPFYYYNQTNENAYTTGYKSENHFISLMTLFDHLSGFFQQQQVESDYRKFLVRARITEFSGLLLHTKANLRRKYSFTLGIEEIDQFNQEDKLLTKWQYFLLRQIILKRFLLADALIVFAKLIRLIFNIKF